MDTVHERSAGGLLVRGPEVLLISLAGGERWQLPKGHVEPGESEEQAAVREVREETGVTGRPLERLPEIEYWFVQAGQRVHKQVDYFLLEYERGSEPTSTPRGLRRRLVLLGRRDRPPDLRQRAAGGYGGARGVAAPRRSGGPRLESPSTLERERRAR